MIRKLNDKRNKLIIKQFNPVYFFNQRIIKRIINFVDCFYNYIFANRMYSQWHKNVVSSSLKENEYIKNYSYFLKVH